MSYNGDSTPLPESMHTRRPDSLGRQVPIKNPFYADILGPTARMVWSDIDCRARIFFDHCRMGRYLHNNATTTYNDMSFGTNAKHLLLTLGDRRTAWVLAALTAESGDCLRVQNNTKGLQIRVITDTQDEANNWFDYMAKILS